MLKENVLKGSCVSGTFIFYVRKDILWIERMYVQRVFRDINILWDHKRRRFLNTIIMNLLC